MAFAFINKTPTALHISHCKMQIYSRRRDFVCRDVFNEKLERNERRGSLLVKKLQRRDSKLRLHILALISDRLKEQGREVTFPKAREHNLETKIDPSTHRSYFCQTCESITHYFNQA